MPIWFRALPSWRGQLGGLLVQPADGVAGWRRGKEVIEIHVARAIAGFDPFRAAGAAVVKPQPLLVGLGEQRRVGDDHVHILAAVHGLTHAREGVSERITTYTSLHCRLPSCALI